MVMITMMVTIGGTMYKVMFAHVCFTVKVIANMKVEQSEFKFETSYLKIQSAKKIYIRMEKSIK